MGENEPALDPALTSRLAQLDNAIDAMAGAPDFSKNSKLKRVIDALQRVLTKPGGFAAVQARTGALEDAGLFDGSDWSQPDILVPSFVGTSLRSGKVDTVVLEATSELRMLAIVAGEFEHPPSVRRTPSASSRRCWQ